MEPVRGKIVFITGASSGIGAATAKTFAQQGARLLLCARRTRLLEAEVENYLAAGAEAVHIFELDVRERATVERTIASLPDDWQAIDILVNNAGLARGLAKFYEDDIDNWDEMIDTNVKGLLYVSRAVIPGMVKRNRGHIVNIGSVAGYYTYPGGGAYCGTKAAEKSITEGMKIDLLGTNVRVTSVDPGMVETEFSKVRFHGDDAKAVKVYENVTPLTGEDVADCILWATTRPRHVDVQFIMVTCVDQASPHYLHRHKQA